MGRIRRRQDASPLQMSLPDQRPGLNPGRPGIRSTYIHVSTLRLLCQQTGHLKIVLQNYDVQLRKSVLFLSVDKRHVHQEQSVHLFFDDRVAFLVQCYFDQTPGVHVQQSPPLRRSRAYRRAAIERFLPPPPPRAELTLSFPAMISRGRRERSAALPYREADALSVYGVAFSTSIFAGGGIEAYRFTPAPYAWCLAGPRGERTQPPPGFSPLGSPPPPLGLPIATTCSAAAADAAEAGDLAASST
ncbi:unnamed protein product, partial [Nesidiocoris tenuis]